MLRAAYVFLRNVEHRLQYRDDRQTQRIPDDGAELAALARGLRLRRKPPISRRRSPPIAQAVGAQFDAAFGDDAVAAADSAGSRTTTGNDSAAPSRAPDLPALAAIWRGDADADIARDALAQAGFDDPAGLVADLARLRASNRYVALPALSQQRVDDLVPAAPAGGRGRAEQEPSAQTVFKRLFGLLEAISRRSAYLALLIEHPPVLPRLAHLMGASSWAADYLTRHPLLLDELLDARVLLADAGLGRVARRSSRA